MFVRFQSKYPRPDGRYNGVFGLTNILARNGMLSPEEYSWWRANNDWADATYTDPSTVDPSIFDLTRHPHTACWFKESATHLLSRVPGYLHLLNAHRVEWVEVHSTDPGLVLYEDDVQIVVVPYAPEASAETSAAIDIPPARQ